MVFELLWSVQNGWTALMLATAQGHATEVALLLSAGARVDQQDKVYIMIVV